MNFTGCVPEGWVDQHSAEQDMQRLGDGKWEMGKGARTEGPQKVDGGLVELGTAANVHEGVVLEQQAQAGLQGACTRSDLAEKRRGVLFRLAAK